MLLGRPADDCHERSEEAHAQDLRAAVKGGLDPNGFGSSVVAADVLWSDPVAEPGLRANAARGVGLIFGPDITQVSPKAEHFCYSTAWGWEAKQIFTEHSSQADLSSA